ncbi:MAG: phenylalanine--tRNA ligase subunit beta [Rickettsiales bacterium]|nr:phenylalanine--tRNA ligase subunit beta [Rickettsiales bacterium]
MKFTLSWLKQFLDTDVKLEEISNALTAIGLEVEEVIDKAVSLECFKVAKVIDVTKHLEADKLNICKVDDGNQILQIICGAKNVAPNMKVILASVGDVIPANGLQIEKRMLRGVESNGMLCSAEEIGLEKESEGIMELPQNLVVGTKLIDQMPQLIEQVIEISITPNRGDCLGVYGIARDLAAYGVGKLRALDIPDIKSTISDNINIEVDTLSGCPLYASRYFSGVQNSLVCSEVTDVLRSVDEQTISALVDISNYFMFSYNAPMHVYDADKIVGSLVIRNAKDKERFCALDGKEYILSHEDIVIADSEKVCALAGIIGGDESKCDLTTKNILLEVAVFDKQAIIKTARRLGIETDAKHRNERGIDHNFVVNTLEIASKYIVESCGGQAGDIRVVGVKQINKSIIDFDISLVSKITGLDVSKDKILSILKLLGFGVIKNDNQRLSLSIPTWRHDINISEDLVEEVVRIFGYDNLVSKPLDVNLADTSSLLKENNQNVQIKRTLSAKGYNELVTWSFMSSKMSEKFGLSSKKLIIKNPIGDHLNQMRDSIIPNLLQAIKSNKQRSFDNLAFFELGPVYQDKQRKCLAAVRAGFNTRESIYSDRRAIDFFDLKDDMIESLKVCGVDVNSIEFSAQEDIAWYHPGKSAIVSCNNKVIGYVGEIHPAILKMLKIGGAVVAFELFFENIECSVNRSSIEFSDYQLVEKDIAFVVDQNMPVSNLEKVILSLEKVIIKDFYIFDIYSDDEQLGKGKKSIAIKLLLQSDDKTLNKEEIDDIFSSVTCAIEDQLKGKLRTF